MVILKIVLLLAATVVLIPSCIFGWMYLDDQFFIQDSEQWQIDNARKRIELYVNDVSSLSVVQWNIGDMACSYERATVSVIRNNEIHANSSDGFLSIQVAGKKEWTHWRESPFESVESDRDSRLYRCYDVSRCFTARIGKSKYNLREKANNERLLYNNLPCIVQIIDNQIGVYERLSYGQRKM